MQFKAYSCPAYWAINFAWGALSTFEAFDVLSGCIFGLTVVKVIYWPPGALPATNSWLR